MIEYDRLTLPALFFATVNKHNNRNALSFIDETPITYAEFERKILLTIQFLQEKGIKQGDKVAVLSSNMPNWPIAYFAVTFMGAVVVPLLPDFSPSEIENTLNHSEAKAVFVSDNLLYKIQKTFSKHIQHIIHIETYFEEIANQTPVDKLTTFFQLCNEEDLAAIIYTSGTTGEPKGVMLTHKNITTNAIQGYKVQEIDSSDRFLSILPLSHTYENTLGSILPMMCGACVYYLKKPPTPSVLLPALKIVKPTLILSVPLIIEKIYRQKILPSFTKNKVLSILYSTKFFRKKLNLIAGKKLYTTFGGKLKFFGIGGSKVDKTVETFLLEAKFPYAIGYGLTETAPLLAGANPKNTLLQSTGKIVNGVSIKINDPDPKTGEGEIWAKGPNIMKGYYKNKALTQKAITSDGWFKTEDLGVFDKNNNLFIKGRIKNVIVNANGENIYPEEIESIINNFKYVIESLVLEKKGKLVAMVHFNREELEKTFKQFKEEVTGYIENRISELEQELYSYINSRVNKHSRVQLIIVHNEPFVKTATYKIKRFIYT